MMTTRDKPWQIAADIEAMADHIKAAEKAYQAIHESAVPQIDAMDGAEHLYGLWNDLQALSNKFQDIADREVD